MRGPFFRALAPFVALAVAWGGLSCSPAPPREPYATPPSLGYARNIALSWPQPPEVESLLDGMLLRDGGAVPQPELALARAVLHTNPRIEQADALLLAVVTADAARANGLPPEFLGATLLQESAYDVEALSSAGAIGIAQFMPETAAGEGVDPFDPFDAIDGAARLLGGYVRAYRGVYGDPYVMALAAYNAGPAAVDRYGGVPPYAETREYVSLIFDRWARIVSYETNGISGERWKLGPHGKKHRVQSDLSR